MKNETNEQRLDRLEGVRQKWLIERDLETAERKAKREEANASFIKAYSAQPFAPIETKEIK